MYVDKNQHSNIKLNLVKKAFENFVGKTESFNKKTEGVHDLIF